MKHLNDWTYGELTKLPVRESTVDSTIYDTVLLLSTYMEHESGYARIYVIGVNGGQPVEIACNCCDIIRWKFPPVQTFSIWTTEQVRTDCLLASGAMHFYKRNAHFEVGYSASSINIELIPL